MLSTPLALLSLLVGTVLSSPVDMSVHPANVHAIPRGGSIRVVNNEIHLLHANGDIARRDSVSDNVPSSATPLIGDAPAYAAWNNTGDSLHTFNASWTVPSAPVSYTGQTLFYCHTLYSTGIKHALQPALQYGPSAAGGGESWSIALWYRVGSKVYHTQAVPVTTGMSLVGLHRLNYYDNEKYSYTASWLNGESLSIETDIEFGGAVTGLAVNDITSKQNFPADDTVFDEISVSTISGATPSVAWVAVSSEADGITTVVNVDGPTNAKVTMSYAAEA